MSIRLLSRLRATAQRRIPFVHTFGDQGRELGELSRGDRLVANLGNDEFARRGRRLLLSAGGKEANRAKAGH